MKSERLPGLAEPASQEAMSDLGNLCLARDQHRTLLGSEGNMGVTLGKAGGERLPRKHLTRSGAPQSEGETKEGPALKEQAVKRSVRKFICSDLQNAVNKVELAHLV